MVAISIFVLSFFVLLWLYLQWQDRRRAAHPSTPAATRPQQNLEGTVYGLVPGGQYQIIQSFTDYYGNSFKQGDILRFKERHFLPYHGGHTIIFDKQPLYLQEDVNANILDNFSAYIAILRDS